MGKRKDKKPKEIIISDEPRLLHKNPGMGRRDYTDNLTDAADVREVPEPVDTGALKDLQARAHANFKVLHAEEQARREARSLKAKFSAMQARAMREGIDITPEMARISRALKDAEKRLNDAA